MHRETRVIIEPTGSRFKRRRYSWRIENRWYEWSRSEPMLGIKAKKVYGWWGSDPRSGARGYAKNAFQAESKARLWLEEQALKERLERDKFQALVDKVAARKRQQVVINIEEGN